jgi:NADPH:quinone reductase-like Zn-dependent oxidoreductase
MKAAVRDDYGGAEVVKLEDVDRPEPAEDELLVRVRAASINPVDWFALLGMPYLIRGMVGLRAPKTRPLGTDFAGTVEAVGARVRDFSPGGEVFGARDGALGEYICVKEDSAVATKPPNASFEQASAVAVAGVTALQGLRDHGALKAGQKVLVNGASGGVGTFAVQIAKGLGAEVTGVCRTGNLELVRGLGADRVVDYTQADFTRDGERYDLLLDIAGNRSWGDLKRVLSEHSRLVIVGGPKTNRWLGPLGRTLALRLRTVRAKRKAVWFVAKPNAADLQTLAELMESGAVTPAIERTYELSEVGDALAYVGAGHARAKVVVNV